MKAPTRATAADPRLDPISTRVANLADLLRCLADESASNRLREGALYIAADYAAETYDRLQNVIEGD